MAKEINLLPEEEKTDSLVKSQVIRLRRVGIVALLGLGLLSAFLFLGGQFLLSNHANTAATAQALKDEIAQNRDREIMHHVLKDKAGGIVEILNRRPDFYTPLAKLEELMPTGVNLVRLTLDQEKTVTLTIQPENVTALTVFLDNLTNPEKGGKVFGKPYLEDLSYGKETGYRVIMSFHD